LPVIGITKTILPVSVFDLSFKDYEAYDKDRVPFVVDIVAFFRIEDSNVAAQRVANFGELLTQLKAIVQGAIRTVLASHDIDSIMVDRSKFGDAFTGQVVEQLKNWGVMPVKNIELMDIRDTGNNQTIHNIMSKKISFIQMQSRSEVAKNNKDAQIAEITAQQESKVREQEALEGIGKRTAEKDQAVGIASQKAAQAVKEEEKLTKTKEMAVLEVQNVRTAEIQKNVNLVQADQAKQTSIINSEGQKQTAILNAEGLLESKKREAEGTVLVGNAKAEAEKAMQLAPVQAQIVLAQEIGTNENYQKYLVTIRQVEAGQVVGVEQAKALEKADIKIIANTGEPVSGIKNVMDIFTPKGGTSIGGMIEALKQTEGGAELLKLVTPKEAA
jgi:flotillin